MGGQALGLQHIGQCLGVGLGVILVGTLTGAEDEAVFLGLDQCQLCLLYTSPSPRDCD